MEPARAYVLFFLPREGNEMTVRQTVHWYGKAAICSTDLTCNVPAQRAPTRAENPCYLEASRLELALNPQREPLRNVPYVPNSLSGGLFFVGRLKLGRMNGSQIHTGAKHLRQAV